MAPPWGRRHAYGARLKPAHRRHLPWRAAGADIGRSVGGAPLKEPEVPETGILFTAAPAEENSGRRGRCFTARGCQQRAHGVKTTRGGSHARGNWHIEPLSSNRVNAASATSNAAAAAAATSNAAAAGPPPVGLHVAEERRRAEHMRVVEIIGTVVPAEEHDQACVSHLRTSVIAPCGRAAVVPRNLDDGPAKGPRIVGVNVVHWAHVLVCTRAAAKDEHVRPNRHSAVVGARLRCGAPVGLHPRRPLTVQHMHVPQVLVGVAPKHDHPLPHDARRVRPAAGRTGRHPRPAEARGGGHLRGLFRLVVVEGREGRHLANQCLRSHRRRRRLLLRPEPFPFSAGLAEVGPRPPATA